ncbi:MAG: MBL fold metallo-hydrolase [Deltaproteobacteria bacterium]|nr:MBL fold metallo-hydrolase [Deltaproteobacteria bacterium]
MHQPSRHQTWSWISIGFWLAVTLAALVPARGESAQQLSLTYISNEGFLLEAGGRKVLVDALVGTNPRYISMSHEVRSQLEGAEAPFDDVDLVLATHYHGDHFEAQGVGRHLLANPRAVFVSTRQAVEKLQNEFSEFSKIEDRVHAAAPKEGQRHKFPELGLEVLNLHHGRNRRPLVENHGFVFEVGSWKILHVGDTEAQKDEFAANSLDKDGIDVALLPGWIVFDSTWEGVISEAIQPGRVAVMHLPPNWKEKDFAAASKQAQEALFFRHALEIVELSP